jgi:hypothetical protein
MSDEQQQQHGIKETLELVALLQEAADAVKAAKADGQINWKDLPKISGLLWAAKSAVQGSDKIKVEVAELSKEELDELLTKIVAAVSSLIISVVE